MLEKNILIENNEEQRNNQKRLIDDAIELAKRLEIKNKEYEKNKIDLNNYKEKHLNSQKELSNLKIRLNDH